MDISQYEFSALESRRVSQNALARHQVDGGFENRLFKGVDVMIKLGKVSVETRGDKSQPDSEVTWEPEIFI